MNKKVLTVCAALLLSSSSFVSVYADTNFKNENTVTSTLQTALSSLSENEAVSIEDGVMTLKGDLTLTDDHYLLIDEDNFVLNGTDADGKRHKLTGNIVITGENVTIKNLDIEFTNDKASKYLDGTVIETKSAIAVFASKVTIDNNKITCSVGTSTQNMVTGISIYPLSAAPEFTITNNTITGASAIVAGDEQWPAAPSFGIQILGGVSNNGKSGFTYFKSSDADGYKAPEKSAVITDFSKSSFEGTTITDSATDFGYIEVSADVDAATGTTNVEDYKIVTVTPNVNEAGEITNAAAIEKAVTNATEGAEVTFKGSSEQLREALEDAEIDSDVNAAVVCEDANVLFGDVENPDNGQEAVANTGVPVSAEVYDYELQKTADQSNYYMLILHSAANGNDYAIVADADGTASAVELTSQEVADRYAKDKNALWKMTETKLANGQYSYSFVNQNEVQLKSNAGEETENPAGTGLDGVWYPVSNVPYSVNGVAFDVDGLELSIGGINYFGLYKAGQTALNAGQLNYYEKDGFSLTITYDKEGDNKFDDKDIAGNYFTGHLTPMTWNGSKFVQALPTEDHFYLMNANGDFVVVTKNATEGEWDWQDAYEFTTVSAWQLAHDIERNMSYAMKADYYGKFSFYVSASITDFTKLSTIEAMQVSSHDGSVTANVGRLDIKAQGATSAVPTLVASQGLDLKAIKIALGSDQIVKIADLIKNGKFYTVTRVDAPKGVKEGILAATGVYNYDFVSSVGNELEAQWALTVEGANYVFTNRENTNVQFSDIATAALYKTDKADTYRHGSSVYEIKTVAEHHDNDGYRRLTDLKNTKFNLGFVSNVFNGNAWFVENHEGTENHTIGLDSEQENALTFTATEYAAARAKKHNVANHMYTYVPTDSIYVISKLGKIENGAYAGETLDTLKVVSYSFVNQYNEPLIYNSAAEKYQSLVYKNPLKKERFESVEEAEAYAQKFALRYDGDALNLRPVKNDQASVAETAYNSKTATLYQVFDADEYNKVYAGDSGNGILDNVDLYDRTENDWFVVEETDKPMYRRVVSPSDTISIFRDNNNMSVLFEDGQFLGMENLAQFPNMAPGMVADTAYIGNGDTEYYRPQYMLLVDPTIHPAGMWCKEHQSSTCEHAVPTKGWTEGRYLVNLKDTAIAWDIANKHKDGNPYINSEKYYRLGFVEGIHRNDSLIVASDNKKIFVGDENFNVAKFAFRYVDEEAGSFVIETADYRKLDEAFTGTYKGEGYLKWMNNVVVVVDDINNADVYNMNEAFEGNPTANESIEANGAVSVVAADGGVIVRGAEGKNVVVSTILGKVVANETLTSDNETIAAPAGIVVVSVDGESFKVVVK